MSDSNISARKRNSVTSKPKKPHKDYPLYPHASGRWAKKVLGKTRFFGKWDDPQAALNKWLDQKDDLLAGRKPRQQATGRQNSISDACNHYLDFIEDKVKNGERSPRWYEDIKRTLDIMLEVVGRNWAADSLTQDDFADVAKRFRKNKDGKTKASPITTRNHIHRVKGMFNWCFKADVVESMPKYGPAFDPPDKQVVDRHADDQQERYLTRKEIRGLLRVTKDSNQQLYAAILLAINTGCQNADCESLQLKHIDFDGGWYIQPRSKKAKKRRMKLWPRTLKALKAVIGDRDLGADDLIFQAVKTPDKVWRGRNCIGKEFGAIKADAGITTLGAGFQWIRHTFITEASQSGDLLAVQLACGHAPRSITENYIRDKYDKRLVAIAKHLNDWLVGGGK